MVDLKDKRVFVTGGAKGIGRAVVTEFCRAGCRVAFCDTDKSSGEMVSRQTGARFLNVDVSDAAELSKAMLLLFESWDDLDILINNAGVSCFAPITEVSVDEFDRILNINLRSVFITSKLLAEHRITRSSDQKYGRIINIASTRWLMSEPDSEAYAASKGGIYSLSHALALSLSHLGITVNSISPGWIETGDYDSLKKGDHAQHPSGRVGKPEDIARMCLFLSEPDNDFINAQNLVVDGGMTKKMIYEE